MRTQSSVVFMLAAAVALGCEDGIVLGGDGGHVPGPNPGARGLGGRGGNIPGVDPMPRLIEVIATDFQFSPSQIRAEPGEQLVIVLRNEAETEHSVEFEIEGQTHALDRPVAPGETGQLHLVMPVEPGNHAFRCPHTGDEVEMGGDLLVLRAPTVRLEQVTSGLVSPIDLVAPLGDANARRFVVDQIGLVRVLTYGDQLLPHPFLDLRERLVELDAGYDERGLLGLAFHPEFAHNGRLYVHYSGKLREDGPAGWDHTAYVSELTVSHSDPNRVDLQSERVILAVDQPHARRNGGSLAFGPKDGLLYVALGDGGGSGVRGRGHRPEFALAQDTGSWLGKILRLDVDRLEPRTYGSVDRLQGEAAIDVPLQNPFVGQSGADEIFAYGFRNPFGMSFDTGGDNALFVADAGAARWEEIDVIERGGNYGWNVREGTHCFDVADDPSQSLARCPDIGLRGEPLLPPVIELPNAAQEGGLGAALVGGHVYRGSTVPALHGRYVFGTFGRSMTEPGALLLVASDPDLDAEGLWPVQRIAPEGDGHYYVRHFLKGIGTDELGELYLLVSDEPGPAGNSGRVFRLKASPDL